MYSGSFINLKIGEILEVWLLNFGVFILAVVNNL